MIITIDGPIATGKSTIAKAVAREVGYIYIDTGAMYRCLTYGLLKNKVDLNDKDALQRYLNDFKFVMKLKHLEKHYFVDDEDVTDKIRLADVTANVSKVSAIKEVREKLVNLQRELASGVNAVVEGRDMGTVVFPKAEIKIFLTGRAEVRAKRRFDELRAQYPDQTLGLTLEQTIEEINKRDAYDMTREISPLRQAEDALVIDTSDLSIPEIVLRILEYKDGLKSRQPH
jgi:cytidylate kinase